MGMTLSGTSAQATQAPVVQQGAGSDKVKGGKAAKLDKPAEVGGAVGGPELLESGAKGKGAGKGAATAADAGATELHADGGKGAGKGKGKGKGSEQRIDNLLSLAERFQARGKDIPKGVRKQLEKYMALTGGNQAAAGVAQGGVKAPKQAAEGVKAPKQAAEGVKGCDMPGMAPVQAAPAPPAAPAAPAAPARPTSPTPPATRAVA